MPFCNKCGAELDEHSKFCSNCGASLFRPTYIVEKPTAAFVLSLVGGIIIFLAGFIVAVIGAIIGGFLGGLASIVDPGAMSTGAAAGATLGFLVAAMGSVCGGIVIVGSALLYTTKISRVRAGSILVLVFSIIAIPFTFGGLAIGFILCLIGAILGLVWKPSPSPLT